MSFLKNNSLILDAPNPYLPLKEAGQIKHGNAARMDWKKACPIDLADEVYVIGNPPYEGK
jgi:hypothetical protein